MLNFLVEIAIHNRPKWHFTNGSIVRKYVTCLPYLITSILILLIGFSDLVVVDILKPMFLLGFCNRGRGLISRKINFLWRWSHRCWFLIIFLANLVRKIVRCILSTSISATSTAVWVARALYSRSRSSHNMTLIRCGSVGHEGGYVIVCWLNS